METNFQRAKSPENKTIRLQQIMDVTDELFHTNTYHEITLSVISKEVGLARGGLYKYVSSKEELFLMIYLQKEEAMIRDICDQLAALPVTVETFSQVFSTQLYRHLDFLKYHQILTAIIETNVSIERLADFKLKNDTVIRTLFERISESLSLDGKHWFSLYLTILYHGVYLYDRTAYQNCYTTAMELAGLEIEDVDFTEDLIRFITILLNGSY